MSATARQPAFDRAGAFVRAGVVVQVGRIVFDWLSPASASAAGRVGSRWLEGPRISVSNFCVSAEGAASSRSARTARHRS